ncbi:MULTISPECIES: hypothetical protein [Methylorubrum]|uniref:hypothetical protein n=1 Tax=Methylorubrum TaxID=2282523 RepID=UPI00103DBBEA|nr:MULTISPECIES: hypothetical protein [Methylorubrum]
MRDCDIQPAHRPEGIFDLASSDEAGSYNLQAQQSGGPGEIDFTGKTGNIIEKQLNIRSNFATPAAEQWHFCKLPQQPQLMFVTFGASQVFHRQRFTDEYVPHNLPISQD